jgi:hypothetical protein
MDAAHHHVPLGLESSVADHALHASSIPREYIAKESITGGRAVNGKRFALDRTATVSDVGRLGRRARLYSLAPRDVRGAERNRQERALEGIMWPRRVTRRILYFQFPRCYHPVSF